MVAEVLNQNQMVQKEDTITRLQRSILSKLETDESKCKQSQDLNNAEGQIKTKLPGFLESLRNRKIPISVRTLFGKK